MLRKFSCELHANEIILLAYYIAAVNIENAFNSDPQNYFPFQGICFTDTFAMYERDDVETFEFALEKNSERIDEQKKEKFRALEAGALIQRVVNDKAVITVLGGQITEMSVDNPRRKERGKAEPVGARAHEEAIVSVL